VLDLDTRQLRVERRHKPPTQALDGIAWRLIDKRHGCLRRRPSDALAASDRAHGVLGHLKRREARSCRMLKLTRRC
jgi:hypothetical protein